MEKIKEKKVYTEEEKKEYLEKKKKEAMEKLEEKEKELKELNLEDITSEKLGTWLWITNNDGNMITTTLLLQSGFKYSANKNKFYFHADKYKKHGKKCLTYAKIKDLYGNNEEV